MPSSPPSMTARACSCLGRSRIQGYGTVIDENGDWVGEPTGPAGPEGPQGPQGIEGADGADGPGDDRADGGARDDRGHGPTGRGRGDRAHRADGASRGDRANRASGATGPQGNTGPQGLGDDGTNRARGRGLTGMTGPIGPAGPAGPQGGARG